MPKDAQPILRETAQSTFKGRIDWRFTTEWKSSEAGIRPDVRFAAANGNAPPAAVDPSRVAAISTEGPFPQALRENSWLKCPPGSQICCGVRAAGGQSLAVARISWLSGDPSKPDASGLSDFFPGYTGLGIADPPAVYWARRPEKSAFYRLFQDLDGRDSRARAASPLDILHPAHLARGRRARPSRFAGLSQTAYASILKTFQALLDRKDVRPGCVIALQTFGAYAGNWNPHAHAIVSDGVFTAEGEFLPLPALNTTVVLQVFRRLWLRRLHQAERLSEAFMNNLLSWVHTGFSVFAGPPVQLGALESLESQARYIARPAMAMDALRQQPDGTLAMESPPDPRTGATPIVLDPLSVDSPDHRAYSRSGTTYPTLLWRLLQPGQGYRPRCARQIGPRSTSPLCRRKLRVCPRNTSHLGPLIKEDLRSRPSLVLVRRRVEDRLRHYSAPDCGPHSAPSPERALPGPRSLRIPRAAPLGRTLPAMTPLSIHEFRCQSGLPSARSVSRRTVGCALGRTSWHKGPVARPSDRDRRRIAASVQHKSPVSPRQSAACPDPYPESVDFPATD